MKRTDKQQLIDTIANIVRETHGVTLDELIRDDRRAPIAAARRAFALWCYSCNISVHHIAEILHRDRATVRGLLTVKY